MKSIVSNWNGTIYKEVDEGKTYKAIALAYKNELMRRVTHHLNPIAAAKLVKLFVDKKSIERAKEEYRQGRKGLEEVYREFNERIINGKRRSFIRSAILSFAETVTNELDSRLLNPLGDIKYTKGIPVGILSVAYESVIWALVYKSGYLEIFNNGNGGEDVYIVGDVLLDKDGEDVDEIEGLVDPIVSKFALRIYRKKGQYLEEEFARKRGYREIVYFGGTEDDLPCFDYVTSNGGRAALPFFLIERAKTDLKAREFLRTAIEKYNAYAPKDEANLKNFLEKA